MKARPMDKPPVVQLVTIWRRHDGAVMMTVVSGGKPVDYEMPRARLAFLAKELIDHLARV